MDKEMEQFQNDLLESVRQMKGGKAARETHVDISPVAEARYRAPDAWAKKSPSIEGLGMGDQREEKRQASVFFQTR